MIVKVKKKLFQIGIPGSQSILQQIRFTCAK